MNYQINPHMSAEEVLELHERQRQEEEGRQEISRQHAQFMEEREARIAAGRKRDAEIRAGKRKVRPPADDQTDILLEILGDKALPFATYLAGCNPGDIHRRLAMFAAQAARPNSPQARDAQALIEEASRIVHRRIELAEGAL